MQKLTKTFQFGDHQVTLETGRVARQADAAVLVSMADTVVLVTVVAQKTADARYTDGVLVAGDKFTVLESADAGGRLMKVKLTELAPVAPTSANRIP